MDLLYLVSITIFISSGSYSVHWSHLSGTQSDALSSLSQNSQWEGSGIEATAEQQAEIPPVLAEETPAGAAEAAVIKTSYNPDPVAEFESIVLADTTTAATPGTTTTVETTTTTPPTDILIEVIEDAVVEPTVAVDNIAIPLDLSEPPLPFDDDFEPPLFIEPEPLLVDGATTDGVIDGTDDNEINGGVITDKLVPNSGNGDAKLEFALNEPPTIEEAGARTIGPFDCR